MNIDLGDLDLDLTGLTVPASRGRNKVELQYSYLRDIGTEDVKVLLEAPDRGIETPSLLKLRTRHHHLARLLAEGLSNAECQLITGYSPARISILKNDPAFADLVEYYSEQVKEVYINVHQRLAGLGLDVLEELQQRLEEKPESFTHTELRQLMETSMDRGGYGPKSTQVHEVGGNLSELLTAVKEEVRNKQNGRIKTLDAQALPSPSRVTGSGGNSLGEASEHPSGEIVRFPREGEEL